MIKKLGLFIAVILVVVQTLSVWHMAEHAFCKHTHNGKDCDIAFAFDNSKIISTPEITALPQLAFFIIRNITPHDSRVELALYPSSHPRAPPFMALA